MAAVRPTGEESEMSFSHLVHDSDGLRILVGGVPFGRDNIGDEAILSCVVGALREVAPDASITVSTDCRASTEAQLGVRACPLFGFVPPGYDEALLERTLREHDVFVWGGATGLSDYPEVSLSLMEKAQNMGLQTVIFGTGMSSELNPNWYRVRNGLKRRAAEWASTLMRQRVDLIARKESRMREKAMARMRRVIPKADLIVTRDEASARRLRDVGCDGNIVVGADPAISLVPGLADKGVVEDSREPFLETNSPKVGLGISAQRPVQDIKGLACALDRIGKRHNAKIIGIPMNPVTDTEILNEIREKLESSEEMTVSTGVTDPADVAGVAAEMDVVIASRLHLLILASISHVPVVGIGRGAKVGDFLNELGGEIVGTVEDLDPSRLEAEVERHLLAPEAFKKSSEAARARMLERLQAAKSHLGRVLAECGRSPKRDFAARYSL